MRRMRRIAAAGTVVACMVSGSPAFALNPSLDVSQYAHTSWKIREGFIKGPITDIAQTPDGYLWLGTEFGLVRFDGVRAVPWQPPANQPLPAEYIARLLAARDGTLWIGTSNGLASWNGRTLAVHPDFAGAYIGPIAEDREGTIWLSSYPTQRLCAVRQGRAECATVGDGQSNLASVFEDKAGVLWVAVRN